jgi:predicted glutamine amidotransferase
MGYVSHEDHSLSEFVGPAFNEFAELSSLHCDGWGVSGIETGATAPTLVLEPTQASKSEAFKEVTESSKSDGALLHLRWATAGLPVKSGNTHPFTHGEISFIHNGGVLPATSLEPYIDQDLLAQLRGDTDSERYFALIITQMRTLGVVEGALAAVRLIKAELNYTSLNAMLLTSTQMIVINEHTFKAVPPGQTEAYYDLYYRKDADGVLVASSGWDQTGWTLIENHRALVIDRASFEIEELAI